MMQHILSPLSLSGMPAFLMDSIISITVEQIFLSHSDLVALPAQRTQLNNLGSMVITRSIGSHGVD